MASQDPVPRRVGRRQGLRWAALAAATVCLATAFALVPMPRLASAQQMQVRTEHVRPGARSADRSGEQIAAAMAVGKHGIELRAALGATDRRSSPPTGATFQALGISLPVAPAGAALVRARVAGSWTPWVELDFSPGEGPDLGAESPTPGAHSEPIWFGVADGYELDVPGDVTDLDVHLVGDRPAGRSIVLDDTTAGAAGAPSIRPRSAWAARPPAEHPAVTADLKIAVVHHSVNANTYTSAEVPGLLRSIQAYHQDVQGWDDIAYNFAVDRFGQIWEARDGGTTNVVLGGHAQGFNTGSVGVVVLGDFTSATAPAAALESVAQVVAWKFALHRVDPTSTVPVTSGGSAKYAAGTAVTLPRIVGHRDVQLTSCPGELLYGSLATIRARVDALLPSYQQGLAPVVLAPDSDGNGLTDPLGYRPGSSADTLWKATSTGAFSKVPTSIKGAYRPAVGDFDGDGRSDVLWHGTGSMPDPMWWGGPTGYATQYQSVHGSYVPVVGDFDGNGVDDIFWYGTGLDADYVWYFSPDRTRTSLGAKQDLSTAVPLVGDFDGDGKDDIFFYGPGDADDSLWRGNGQSWTVSTRTVDGWYDPVVLDATADGIDDILWFSPGGPTSYRWTFTAAATTSSTTLTTSSLQGRPVVGDFDGDGRDDVLLAAAGGGADQTWYSTATGIDARSVSVNGTYEITAGPMDVSTGLLTDDVLFLSSSGAVYLWQGLADRTFRSTKVG